MVEGHQLSINPQWAGFKIPYFNLSGKVTSFFRFRYLQHQASSGFGALVEPSKKPLRYTQPKNSTVEAYFPPLLGGLTWREVANNTEMSVGITEGELKAACACANELITCIGLGGVYNWQSAKLRQDLIPSLKEFKWKDRDVYMMFDSDSANNIMVNVALSRLTRMLTNIGALVHVVKLPPAQDGGKQGLDDMAYAMGVEAVGKLVAEAQPDQTAVELHRMNEEFAVIRGTSEVIEFSTNTVWSMHNFVNSAENHRFHKVDVLKKNKDGEVKETREERPTAKEWVAWPMRTQMNRLEYAPGGGPLLEDGINTWRGWACEPKRGVVKPWLELLEYLFPNEQKDIVKHLMQWFAYPLQNPGVKLHTAVVVWGSQQGTGKTLLGTTMRYIYGDNFRSIGNTELTGNYNEWAANRQFIVGDEISVGQQRSITDMLKDVITREQVTINQKYRAHYTIRDCINYYFTSNHPDAFFLTDQDRRYLVLEAAGIVAAPKFYASYTEWLKGGGAAALFYYLLNEVDCTTFNPAGRAPETLSRKAMIMDNRSDLDNWLITLVESPDIALANKPHDLWTSADLLKVYDPDNRSGRVSAGTISKVLTAQGRLRHCCSGTAVPTATAGRVRVYAVRNRDKYARLGPAAVGKLYDEERIANDPKRKFEALRSTTVKQEVRKEQKK